MNQIFKLITSKETVDVLKTAKSAYNDLTSKKSDEKQHPREFNPKIVHNVYKQHNEFWFTAETKNEGFVLVYEPKKMIVFRSKNIKDLDLFSMLFEEFKEIPTRHDDLTIINTIIERKINQPDLKPVYFAVSCGLTQYVCEKLKNTNFGILNETFTNNEETLVHIAIKYNQEVVRILINEHFDVLKKTKDGNNIAHYAVQHVNMIKAINESVPENVFLELLQTENYLKKTPVHLSLLIPEVFDFLNKICPDVFKLQFQLPLVSIVLNLNPDNLHLIERVCEQLKSVDLDFLSRPVGDAGQYLLSHKLHIEVLKILMKHASEKTINLQDETLKSSLHYAVIRQETEVILSLIAFGANLNLKDIHGKTPLCYAVELNSSRVVKALLLFGSSVDDKIKNLKTTREIQTAIQQGSTQYYELETRDFKWDESTVDHIALKKSISYLKKLRLSDEFNVYNAISFDGGGIRGIVALQILREIENRFGQNFLTFFKTIGGTSTGSILSLAIAKYQNLTSVLKLYLRIKDDIFYGTRPYSGDQLEKRLIEELGFDTLADIGEKKQMRLAVYVTRIDTSPPKLEIFRSFSIPDYIKDSRFHKLENWSAAKVIRCSCAAPTYFPAVDEKYMDGGIMANNPSCELLCDHQTISLLLPQLKQHLGLLLSIGTGKAPEKKIKTKVENSMENILPSWVSSFNSLIHMKNIFIDQVTSTDGIVVDRARLMSSAMNTTFLRFSPELSKDFELDETRADFLIDMMWDTKIYMHSRLNDVNILIYLLNSLL